VRRVILRSLWVLVWCFQAGCYVHQTTVDTTGLESKAGIRLIDPNDGPYSIEVIRRKDGRHDYLWEIDSKIMQTHTGRINYHKLYSTNRFMVVEGRVGNGSKTYPVVLDTGASQPVFVKESHVTDNNLAIFPMQTKISNGYKFGLCHLPKLQIANVTLVDWPCLYLERRSKSELFGLSIAKDHASDDSIILGLPALREFKYIVFDNVRKEVEFSYNELFKPEQSELWEQYPLSIEEDFHGNAFLFVKIPIAGEESELQLDTGSGRGLALSEELWEGLREKIHDVKLTKGRDFYPYIGWLACRRAVIPTLEVGNRTVSNAELSVFPSDSPIVEDCEGLLGMQYFQDTIMVLDFENELMWVKNSQRR
jgi:hypothetical protein